MTKTETINTSTAVSEFLWDEDAPEILLNNLPSFNKRTEDIVELTSYIDEHGTDERKHYLPYCIFQWQPWDQKHHLYRLNPALQE